MRNMEKQWQNRKTQTDEIEKHGETVAKQENTGKRETWVLASVRGGTGDLAMSN